MSAKYFIDTNIFIYSFDSGSPAKKEQARELIMNALETHRGCISYQVIQEFLNVATGKFEQPLSIADSEKYLNRVLSPLCEIFATFDLFSRALDIKERWQYSFYDSLIIAAALQANCNILYSMDLQHGQAIQSLTVRNPFE